MQNITFDPAGGKLWVSVKTGGLYAISFTYTLLESDDAPQNSPAVLTIPMIAGDNLDGEGEHHFAVVNSFHPNEPLALYDGRFIDTSFFIKVLQDDAGFAISVHLFQGDDFLTAVDLGGDGKSDQVGDGNNHKTFGIKFKISKS